MDSRLGNIHKRLESIRGAAMSWDVFDLGLKTDEAIGVLNAFSQAGYTLKEIRGDAKGAKEEMQAYAGAIKTAATFSRLLGEKTDAIATSMAEYMEALNLSLGEIAERYAAVTQAAMQAGFGTKRFYGMVLQATSGMAMFNMRMEEAAALLLNVSKFMNPKLAGEFVQSLSEGFADMDMKERRKTIMKAGAGTYKRLFGYEGRDAAGEFLGQTGGTVKSGGKAGARTYELLEDFFAKYGVKTGKLTENTKETQKNLVAALSKMDSETANKMVSEMRLYDTDMAKMLDRLIRVSEGTSGEIGDMARNMDTLTGSRVLLAKAFSTKGITGKSVEELTSELQSMGFEGMSGISGKALTELVTTMKGYSGNWDLMAKMDIARFKNAEKDSEVMKEFLASQKETAEKFGLVKEIDSKIYKATVDADGNVIKQKDAIENMEEYIATQGDALMEASKRSDVSEMTKLTRNVSTATITMADRLEHGIQMILEKIWVQISRIVGWITGDKFSDDVKADIPIAMSNISKRILDAQKKVTEQEGAIPGLKTKLAGAKDPEERKAIEAEIKNRVENAKAFRVHIQKLNKASDILLNLTDEEGLKKLLKVTGDYKAGAGSLEASAMDAVAEEKRKKVDRAVKERMGKEWGEETIGTSQEKVAVARAQEELKKESAAYKKKKAWERGRGISKQDVATQVAIGVSGTGFGAYGGPEEEARKKRKPAVAKAWGTELSELEKSVGKKKDKVAEAVEILAKKTEKQTLQAERKAALEQKIREEESAKLLTAGEGQSAILDDISEAEKRGQRLQKDKNAKTNKFEDFMQKSAPEEWAEANVEAQKRLVAENVVAAAGIKGEAAGGMVEALLAGKVPRQLK